MRERVEIALGVGRPRERQVLRVVELRDDLVGEESPPGGQPYRVAVLFDKAGISEAFDVPGKASPADTPVSSRKPLLRQAVMLQGDRDRPPSLIMPPFSSCRG